MQVKTDQKTIKGKLYRQHVFIVFKAFFLVC